MYDKFCFFLCLSLPYPILFLHMSFFTVSGFLFYCLYLHTLSFLFCLSSFTFFFRRTAQTLNLTSTSRGVLKAATLLSLSLSRIRQPHNLFRHPLRRMVRKVRMVPVTPGPPSTNTAQPYERFKSRSAAGPDAVTIQALRNMPEEAYE